MDVAQGQSAHATSNIDLAHTAGQAVDGTSSSYWAADPEDEEKIFWISFPQSRSDTETGGLASGISMDHSSFVDVYIYKMD